MAILPVHQMIDRPDYIGSVREGLQFGQQQRALREKQADQQKLRELAPGVIQGDPAAFSQAAVIDPAAAGQYQDAGDAQMRRAEGLINLMEQAEQSGNPEYAQRLWQTHGVPYARQFSQGAEPTANWAEAKPMLESLKAKIAMAKAGGDATALPTGFRELDLKARAAGYLPGSPEYQQAMQVGVGTRGRAATGGFGFELVRGADGLERVQRRNPRTGAVEIYDEATGNFVPLGSGGSLNSGGAPAPPPAEASGMPVQFDNPGAVPPAVQAAIQANPEGWGAVPDGGIAPPIQAPPANRATAIGVGRSPESQAALTTAAQEEARLRYLPEQERIKTDAAIRQAGGIEAAKTQAERMANQPKVISAMQAKKAAADRVSMFIDQAIAQTDWRAAGVGAWTKELPSTPARNLRATLDTIRANIGFDRLEEMRMNSPTGGALGQVAVQEINYLQAVLANLEQDQSATQLRDNLAIAKQQIAMSQQRIQDTYEQTYSNQPATSSQSPDIDALLDKYPD